MGALIGVSATPTQRRHWAVETILGVALGIGTADAPVVLIGDGTLRLAAALRVVTVHRLRAAWSSPGSVDTGFLGGDGHR
jgi:hypothetical protein